ncbi:MAG: GH116 family glycosyl-hydrolase [Planctomycetota bacterium]|nr:GH116 family glycosyl-hydrolase [Planctomycetota bacterium]
MRRPPTVVAVLLIGAVSCAIGFDGSFTMAKTPRVVNAGTGDHGVVDDTPYYGGFGTGFLHVNADGTYGNGEIRSGELGLKFYGPTFGGPYRFQLFVRHAKGEWSGDLVAGAASGMRVGYLPLFPKCQYTFQHDAIPLDVKMEAFAPWTPGDSRMSSLPVLFFDFQVTNPDAAEKTVALAFMVPNPDCDAGKPVIEKEDQVAGVLLQSKRAGGGTLCGMVRNDGDAQVTWGADFAKGRLSGTKGHLLASSIVLPAKSTRHVVFILAWDFPVYISGDGQKWPRKELGHYHSNFYQGADAIALDCRNNYTSIHAGVDAWFRRMWNESNLPQWMLRQILTSTSHMAYNGVFFKNGQAAMKEGDCFPLVGTYDEQFFCSLAELLFLPEAEWGNLQIFANATTPQGAIRHDLGTMCVTAESTSEDHTVPYSGKRTGFWDAGDNTPGWILDLYRDYLWTGNTARLKALWPTVEKGCAYMLTGDKDNNGLYDDGKTYDCFGSIPENMYINDLQRAAFQAAAKMADVMGDARSRDAYAARSELMAKKLEELWNPKGFYGAGRSQPDNPMATALLGEHSDDLLCMPRQLDPERVRRHLQYMGTLGQNFNGKTFQVMQREMPGGWVAETIMSNAEGLRDYCSLALWRGCTREGMAVAKCFYDVIFEHLQREWNQPMLITADRNPIFGNHYQSVPAAWHLLLGLEGLAWDVPGRKLWIRPNLPESFQGKLRAFLPGAITWGGLDYSRVEPDCSQKFVLTFEHPFELEFLGVRNSGKPTVSATRDGTAVPCSLRVVDASEYEVRFTPPLRLDAKPLAISIGSKQ